MRRLLFVLLLTGCEDNVAPDTGGYLDADRPDAPPAIDAGAPSRDAVVPTPDDDGGQPSCGTASFSHADRNATEVFVTGDFSAWSDEPPGALALVSDGAGHFGGTRYLGPGRHLYKLIVDGAWIADPGNPVSEPDGFGGTNSVLVLCEE